MENQKLDWIEHYDACPGELVSQTDGDVSPSWGIVSDSEQENLYRLFRVQTDANGIMLDPVQLGDTFDDVDDAKAVAEGDALSLDVIVTI